jgi:hypothetical protein
MRREEHKTKEKTGEQERDKRMRFLRISAGILLQNIRSDVEREVGTTHFTNTIQEKIAE